MNKITSNVERITVDLESLQVDRRYQREIKPHSRVIAKNFDPKLCDDLFICRRDDGSLWILDGQQRREGLLSNGYKKWRARIIESAGVEWEARMFLMANGVDGSKKMPSALEMFKAKLAAKEEIAVAVVRVLKRVGLNPPSKKSEWPDISCVSVLCSLLKTHGEEVFERGMKLLVRTWPMSDEALKDVVVWAVVRVVGNNPQLDEDHFYRQLKNVPALKLLHDAKSAICGGRIKLVYKVIVSWYNKGMSSNNKKRIIVEDVEDDGLPGSTRVKSKSNKEAMDVSRN